MKQLIINADDFGLHETVNTGIIYGYQHGSITSTSLMAGGRAAEHAAQLAAENPGLGVGVHLTLVGERPVSDPAAVPTLVDAQGRLPDKYPEFLKQFFTGRVRLREVRRELEAQIEKVRRLGVPITHFDSHQHIHVVPGISDIVVDLARQFQVRAVRYPAEGYFFFGGYPGSAGRVVGRNGLSFLARAAKRKFRAARLATPDHFYGMLAGGSMREEYLLRIVQGLPAGISEVMMHPGAENETLNELYGWNYHWREELAAACSPLLTQTLNEKAVSLISFRELPNG